MIRDTSATDTVLKSKRYNPKKIAYLATTVVFLVASSIWVYPYYKSWSSSDITYDRDKVTVATVSRGEFEESIAAEGNVAAVVKPDMFAPHQGYVELNVKSGESIKKGDLIATIDNSSLAAELRSASGELKEMQHELQLLVVNSEQRVRELKLSLKHKKILLDAAKRKLNRYEVVYGNGAVSKEMLESVEDDVMIAKSDLSQTESRIVFLTKTNKTSIDLKRMEIERQKSVVADIKKEVNSLSIESPIDGVVGEIKVDDGDFVTLGQEIAGVVDLSTFGVNLLVPETYANNIEVGMTTIIHYEGSSYQGVVSSISPEVVDNRVQITSEFEEIPSGDLRQNQRVTVKIVKNKVRDALKVTRGRMIGTTGRVNAYRVEGDIATPIEIEVGTVGVSEVEIKKGVKEGDRIVISGLRGIPDNSTVYLR